MTTGKNKDNFEKWLLNQPYMLRTGALQWFYELPFEMQFNSYVAYYDYLGIDIEIGGKNSLKPTGYSVTIIANNNVFCYKSEIKSRYQAYKVAIEEANLIMELNLIKLTTITN